MTTDRIKTLYVSDMDGTLLNADSKVSPKSSHIISSLTRNGAMITVATARTPATVVPLLSGADISIPAIVMTGAAMWDWKANRYISPKFIDTDAVSSVCGILSSHGMTPFVYTLEGDCMLSVYHTSPSLTTSEQGFVTPRMGLPLKRFLIGTPIPETAMGRTMLIFAIGRIGEADDAAADITAATGCAVSAYPDIFNRNEAFIEVFAPGVSKAQAVRELAKRTGADRTVVFGDNLNDIPMMEAADLAVAVGNAFEEVKAAADITIGANTADSVAMFIENDFNSH